LLRETLGERTAERFPLCLAEFAPRTPSTRLEKERFKVFLGLFLLILADQVANVFAHAAVTSGLDSGIDDSPQAAYPTSRTGTLYLTFKWNKGNIPFVCLIESPKRRTFYKERLI
jgi:hypothetical protein